MNILCCTVAGFPIPAPLRPGQGAGKITQCKCPGGSIPGHRINRFRGGSSQDARNSDIQPDHGRRKSVRAILSSGRARGKRASAESAHSLAPSRIWGGG